METSSDFEALKKLFDMITRHSIRTEDIPEGRMQKVHKKRDPIKREWYYDEVPVYHILTLGCGSGYSGFEAVFYFDKEGKFIDHAIME